MTLQFHTEAVIKDTSNFPKQWILAYCVALVVSGVSSMAAAIHMFVHARKKLRMTRSAVRFVIWNYLITTSLHAWVALAFYLYLLGCVTSTWDWFVAEDDGSAKETATWVMDDDTNEDGPQADIMSKFIHSPYPTHSMGILITVHLENVSLVLCAYWILLITFELFRLTLSTFDRGAKKELKTIEWYMLGACLLLVAFIGAGFVLWGIDNDLRNAYRFLAVAELAVGVVVIVYASGSLLYLKRKGRQLEVVQGVRMRSPLYRRLKSLLVVCTVFTLPYTILEMILLALPIDVGCFVPDYLVGICTILYYLFGTAQAIILGTSQACCFRVFTPLMPSDIRDAPEFRHLRSTSVRQADGSSADGSSKGVEPPAKENVVFVNTDIESSSALWAQAGEEVMDIAQTLHDDLLRQQLVKHRGYEITTAGDAFQLAFHSIQDAVEYCLSVQIELVKLRWPSELDEVNIAACKTERLKSLSVSSALPTLERGQLRLHRSGQYLFRGLRVRMGIHDANADEGTLVLQTHPVTGKMVYIGASELIGREIGDVGFGGEIMVSHRIAEWLRVEENKKLLSTPFVLRRVGWHEVACLELSVALFELLPSQLKDRASVFHDRQHELSGKIDFLAPKIRSSTTATSDATRGDDDADERVSSDGQGENCDEESSTSEESFVDVRSVHSAYSFELLKSPHRVECAEPERYLIV